MSNFEPAEPLLRPVQRRSVTDEIVDQLVELVAGGAYPDNRLPPERRLCEQLGVSRTALREALSALTHLNILQTRGKAKYGNVARARAYLVAATAATSTKSVEEALVSDPLEVRRLLEPQAAALAAERANAEALGEIEEWLRLMEDAARRGDRGIEYDTAFHVSIARATGNVILVELVAALSHALRASRTLSFEPREAVDAALADHRAILDALRRRDPAQARQAMIRHLTHVERLIRWSLTAGRRRDADVGETIR